MYKLCSNQQLSFLTITFQLFLWNACPLTLFAPPWGSVQHLFRIAMAPSAIWLKLVRLFLYGS